MPLYGSPRLSTMDGQLRRRDDCANGLLHLIAEHGGFLDARAACGARKCNFSWPASTLGKKSCPGPAAGPDGKASSAVAAITAEKQRGEAHAAVDGDAQQVSIAIRAAARRRSSKPC